MYKREKSLEQNCTGLYNTQFTSANQNFIIVTKPFRYGTTYLRNQNKTVFLLFGTVPNGGTLKKCGLWCSAFHLEPVLLGLNTSVPNNDQEGIKTLPCRENYFNSARVKLRATIIC